MEVAQRAQFPNSRGDARTGVGARAAVGSSLPLSAAGLALLCQLALGCAADGNGGQGQQTNGNLAPVAGFTAPVAPTGVAGAPVAPVTPPPAVVVAGTGVAGRPAAPVATAGIGAAGSTGILPPSMRPIGTTAGIGAAGAAPMRPIGPTMMAGAGGPVAGMPPPGAANPAAPTSCPAPPAGTAEKAVTALNAVNQLRVASGSTCMNSVPALVQSAQSHCDYKNTNKGNSMCTADAHSEIMGCMGFTGADVQSREVAAGYPRTMAYTEVATTFGNNPVAAVPNWIDTVYHRIPLLDPWTVDMGYGGGPGCDVIDIGRGMSTAPANTIVMYPYDGQTNVAPTWNGLEGPAPPAPASGWPSSYVISLYAKNVMVTDHVITKDGDTTPLAHTFLDKNNPGVASLRNYFGSIVFMYGAPFEANTKYRVKVSGTYGAGALNVEWTFTTGTKRPF